MIICSSFRFLTYFRVYRFYILSNLIFFNTNVSRLYIFYLILISLDLIYSNFITFILLCYPNFHKLFRSLRFDSNAISMTYRFTNYSIPLILSILLSLSSNVSSPFNLEISFRFYIFVPRILRCLRFYSLLRSYNLSIFEERISNVSRSLNLSNPLVFDNLLNINFFVLDI